jgi:shikimate kinase
MDGYYDYHPQAELDRHLVFAGFLTDETRAVGHRLASLMGLPFADLDRKIEHHAGCSVGELVADEGESYYRHLEREQLRRALKDTPFGVVTLGDGALIDAGNRRAVTNHATLVALELDLPSCFFRYQTKAAENEGIWHPVYPGPLRNLEQIRPFYQQRKAGIEAAHVRVDVRGKSLSQMLEATFAALPQLKRAV